MAKLQLQLAFPPVKPSLAKIQRVRRVLFVHYSKAATDFQLRFADPKQQAFTRAANDIFLGSAGLFLLLIGLIWLTKRPARTGGAGAADAAGAH